MARIDQLLSQLQSKWSSIWEGWASGLSPASSLLQSFWYYGAPVLSITILSYLLYKGYKALVAAGAQELLYGVLSIGLLYITAALLRLEFLLWLLDRIIPTLLVILAVILQPELRRIFVQIGRQGLSHYFNRQHQSQEVIHKMIEACEILVRKRRGALLVFCRENMLRHITSTGTLLNATPTSELVVSLFAFDTPLHDGAIVLNQSRILAAGCILPIDPEENSLLTMRTGTRHRAAIELARESDAVVLVVSEESGRISLAFDAQMRSHLSMEGIRRELEDLLITDEQHPRHWGPRRLLRALLPFSGTEEIQIPPRDELLQSEEKPDPAGEKTAKTTQNSAGEGGGHGLGAS